MTYYLRFDSHSFFTASIAFILQFIIIVLKSGDGSVGKPGCLQCLLLVQGKLGKWIKAILNKATEKRLK